MSRKSYRDITVYKTTSLYDSKDEEIEYAIFLNEGHIDKIERDKLVRLVEIIQEILSE